MARHEHQLSMANRKIEDFVTKMADDAVEFLKFAYELRKVDIDNKYTFNLLNG